MPTTGEWVNVATLVVICMAGIGIAFKTVWPAIWKSFHPSNGNGDRGVKAAEVAQLQASLAEGKITALIADLRGSMSSLETKMDALDQSLVGTAGTKPWAVFERLDRSIGDLIVEFRKFNDSSQQRQDLWISRVLRLEQQFDELKSEKNSSKS